MRFPKASLFAALPLLCGCVSGRIYTHTWEPLTTNFDKTPVYQSNGSGESDVRHLSIPTGYYSLDIVWHSNAIGDIAKRDGIEEICYADLESFSVLGIWNQYTVHVYGKAKPKPPEAAAPAEAPKN